MRHVAVLAAAVVMLTVIAVPAQAGKGMGGNKVILDVFEVTCNESTHYVTAVAADKSGREQSLELFLYVDPPDWQLIAYDSDEGTGLIQAEVAGLVNGEYRVWASLLTPYKNTMLLYQPRQDGNC